MTSRPSQGSKRPSVAALSEPAAKPPCKIHSLAVISERAQITGTHSVDIGDGTVLHPYAKIRAEGGRVVIGKNTTLSETAVVGVAEGSGEDEVIIGDEVNIETGAVVEAKSVGEGTIIEVGAIVGKGAVIGKHCKITPLSKIKAGEELADYTVIYGDRQCRVDQTLATNVEVREAKQRGQMMQIELLRKLIPDASAKWR